MHSPHRLESEVLQKYFRHSKFASFQRQLNYFGFRKNAGKGKMAPCSYVNEATTNDISSILMIKVSSSFCYQDCRKSPFDRSLPTSVSFGANRGRQPHPSPRQRRRKRNLQTTSPLHHNERFLAMQQTSILFWPASCKVTVGPGIRNRTPLSLMRLRRRQTHYRPV